MKKKIIIFISVLAIILVGVTLVIAVPNSIGKKITDEIKARGYIEYSSDEAKVLALEKCTQCHDTERILKYCHRCGPPFIAVIPHMRKFLEEYKVREPHKKFSDITDYQASAIIQTWNALVGNWEGDFRKEDALKLIGNNKILVDLYNTPVEKRKIEYTMLKRGDKTKGAYEPEGLGKGGRIH
ncbi:MAG: hypothetical protein A2Z59_08630 [Nitrospinae bacterium RIFCSPLOWO2_02_39_17]|nr:MAG: hypothetical protein A2W53_05105 [Nitrospinae bacterium RIFCSPHIGHO2_02_39_11]OGV97908.1 MAG: hypothetical protein A3D97_03735 [Nitrospinae bacterium RIFCSPHIGHO2_12_FULL_39_42]OGW02741.1 MAG: hypothetical protein A2Z59_08630 [Nitrospinae bacterium RIFCSPLOWO2_02_39_17]OGW09809.1 MAG: hypothetical protein A3F81_00630 [Nitrospinae bacterium RIFCSPLOWO2_12_FULL_39_93]OGW10225.1 MAG: hypothetical protein A2W75_10980 [Nitrospinae bacterium RIFCSPLOWO2_12_39_15]